MKNHFLKGKRIVVLAMITMVILSTNFIGCKKDKQLEQLESFQNNNVPKTSIIGGNPKPIQDARYQAAVFFNGSFNAGGVILSENWILTAAHVVTYPGTNTQIENNKISIQAGSS